MGNAATVPAQSVVVCEAKDSSSSTAPIFKVASKGSGASVKHPAGSPAANTAAPPKSQAGEVPAESAARQDALASPCGAASFHETGTGAAWTQGGSDGLHPSFEKAMTAEVPAAPASLRENAGADSAATAKGDAAFHAMTPAGAAHALGGEAPQTLVATQNVLEVGITGGAHGWLRVRAELGQTGEVTASLVASNASAADMLHKQLGAISAFLKSESVGVSSLAVTAPEKSGASASATYGNAASAGGGTNQGSQGRGRQDAAQPLPQVPSGETGTAIEGLAGWPLHLSNTVLSGQSSLGGYSGGWLNVMA
jgi:hypothetical protein